jgi:hypothetical protein
MVNGSSGPEEDNDRGVLFGRIALGLAAIVLASVLFEIWGS